MASATSSSNVDVTHTSHVKEINTKKEEKVDYLNLPCPIPYEEIHREALMSLKPELFEGMRFDFTKGLNQKFALSHSVFMGPMEVPSQSPETIKIPTAHYEFGANFLDPKLMLVGRILTDGRLNARIKCDLTDNLTLKGNAQLTSEPHMSHGMANFDYKGKDFRGQFQMGNGALFGASYIQSVSPRLSLGSEVFWAGQHRKSGIGFAARYNTDKMVATGQVASTGMVALSYVQKVSDKVSLASDFMYNYMSREVTASAGYDYILRQCRLRGKIDSNGVVAAFLEERLNMGLNFILSAETYEVPRIQHDEYSLSKPNPVEQQLRKFSISVPRPKEETLSRHSILGPNGLRGQWQPPISNIGVQYPSNLDLTPIDIPSFQQPLQDEVPLQKDSSSEPEKSTMEAVLSLCVDAQSVNAEEPSSMIAFDKVEPPIQTDIIRQPSPPPVLADVQDLMPATSPQASEWGCELPDELVRSKSPLQLHISTTMMENFMRLAKSNTDKNLETCGILAGSLKNRKFFVTALIIPKQESTSDSCQATNEEEIFDVQDKQSLFPLGWIHTHPSQSCFMSSIDVHTHYSYQIMLPEAVAIVMAPKDSSRTHGIFRLTNPGGMQVIRHCDRRGFHPHEQPPGGGPIYDHCTDVYMNPNQKFDVIDLRS